MFGGAQDSTLSHPSKRAVRGEGYAAVPGRILESNPAFASRHSSGSIALRKKIPSAQTMKSTGAARKIEYPRRGFRAIPIASPARKISQLSSITGSRGSALFHCTNHQTKAQGA